MAQSLEDVLARLVQLEADNAAMANRLAGQQSTIESLQTQLEVAAEKSRHRNND